MKAKIKCENCEYLKCVDVGYKTYFCLRDDDYSIIGVDYPPKRPPRSCPKIQREMED